MFKSLKKRLDLWDVIPCSPLVTEFATIGSHITAGDTPQIFLFIQSYVNHAFHLRNGKQHFSKHHHQNHHAYQN